MGARTSRPPAEKVTAVARLELLFPPSLGKPKATARAELLEQALTNELGVPVRIRVTADYAELERRALAGEAHLVWAPSGVCARLEARAARAIYKAVRHGVSTYRSALIARAEDNLNVMRLRGLRAVWVDPSSVGGYLLAMDYLRRRGVDPATAFAHQTFCGSHPEVLTALFDKKADLTAVTAWSDDERTIREALALYVGPIERKLAILAVTTEAPTDAMVLTTQLPADDADRIAQRLFPAGNAVRVPTFLLAAMGADGFVRARAGEYEPVLRLLDAR